MSDALEILEQPETRPMYMITGWRQWADGGSISSGLPQYLIQQTHARKIGSIQPDGFYLFQIPGTHDLVRPVVEFEDGYPEELKDRHNELYYTENNDCGVVFLLGDEPHLDMDRYAALVLEAAQTLGVQRIVSLGGVYGELPYNKERMVSSIYSLRPMKDELEGLGVTFSDYHGGASIGSYLCRRASEKGMEFVGFYAFVPTYDLSSLSELSSSIRIENDFMAWLGVLKRINYMLKLRFDVADLERKSEQLLQVVDAKIQELDSASPQLGLRDYFDRLAEEFTETVFDPLGDVWEAELRRLFEDSDEDSGDDAEDDETNTPDDAGDDDA